MHNEIKDLRFLVEKYWGTMKEQQSLIKALKEGNKDKDELISSILDDATKKEQGLIWWREKGREFSRIIRELREKIKAAGIH